MTSKGYKIMTKFQTLLQKKKKKIGRKSSKSSCPNMIKTMELSSKV